MQASRHQVNCGEAQSGHDQRRAPAPLPGPGPGEVSGPRCHPRKPGWSQDPHPGWRRGKRPEAVGPHQSGGVWRTQYLSLVLKRAPPLAAPAVGSQSVTPHSPQEAMAPQPHSIHARDQGSAERPGPGAWCSPGSRLRAPEQGRARGPQKPGRGWRGREKPRRRTREEGSWAGPGQGSQQLTLWQGSTEQMSPTSRSCRDMSSSARSVQ